MEDIESHSCNNEEQPRRPSKKARKALHEANSVYDLPSIEQAIKWMHAVCGYPVKSTWLRAIKAGNFVGWPMLTERNVSKYYPDTDETLKGHMNQTRKNVRSTKARRRTLEVVEHPDMKGKKERDVYISVCKASDMYEVRETTFSDQTGKFPIRSRSGNKYIMIMVEIDSSAILVEPMKSRKDAEMIRAYDALLQRLRHAGINPKKHVMDNEVSENMKNHIRDDCKLKIELVPPGCHRRNAAEVAIRNFKTHFLSILAGVADDFPPSLWDRLLPQTEITLNLLRQSNAMPTVSAYAHLCGPFDYNKMPLAPMGCEVQVHEKTDSRGTWAYHCVDGWYLYTPPDHYRTHVCHIKETKSDRLSDTVHFKHKNITNPELTHADKIMKAIASLSSILKCKPSIKNKHQEEIRELQQLMSSNPSFVKNDTRQEVERTSGRAFKLSKNSHEKTSESHKNLFEKTSESQEAPGTTAGERSSTRLLARKSAERSREENQSSPKQHQATAPRVQQPQESFQRLHQPHAPTSRVQQRSTAPPEVPASTSRVQKSLEAPKVQESFPRVKKSLEVPKVRETRMRTQVQPLTIDSFKKKSYDKPVISNTQAPPAAVPDQRAK
jgi:hypothetical protein